VNVAKQKSIKTKPQFEYLDFNDGQRVQNKTLILKNQAIRKHLNSFSTFERPTDIYPSPDTD